MIAKIVRFFLMSLFISSYAIAANMQEEKVIFLDIDGVLNNYKTSLDRLYVVENNCLMSLKLIIQETNAEIILTSSYRFNEEAQKYLNDRFLANNIKIWKGVTPVDKEAGRGSEIHAYIQENTLKNFVIIDDLKLEDFGKDTDFMKDHFVNTDRFVGLTPKDAQDAIDILNR